MGLVGRQASTASGVIVDPEGYIVTNAHVVAGALSTKVVIARPPPWNVTADDSGGILISLHTRSFQATASSTVPLAAIESAIRVKRAKSKIGQDGFTARVQGGVAYWEGAAGVVQHKGAARAWRINNFTQTGPDWVLLIRTAMPRNLR